MARVLIVGIGAGIAAAILFLSPLGATFLAFPLFVLCSLPIAIAGLGWGALTGAVAAVAAALASIVLFTWQAGTFVWAPGFVHLVLFGGPIAWMTRLALLSRPGEEAGTTEWYPLGRILLHAAAMVAGGLILVALVIGFDQEELVADMTAVIVELMTESGGTAPPPSPAEVEQFARFNVSLLPFAMAGLLLVIAVVNVWLGARIARASGRLARPQEPMWTATLPNEAAIVFVIALVGAFFPGGLGQAAGVVAGAFGVAAALVGLAVIHASTIGFALRTPLLVVMYVVLVPFGFLLVLPAIVGLADIFFQFRARASGRASPPPT